MRWTKSKGKHTYQKKTGHRVYKKKKKKKKKLFSPSKNIFFWTDLYVFIEGKKEEEQTDAVLL